MKRNEVSNVAKNLLRKKLYIRYGKCFILGWATTAFILLNTFSPATEYAVLLINQAVGVRSMTGNNFFNVGKFSGDQRNRTFVSLLSKNVHIYSAIAYNSTKKSVFGSIYLSVWENRIWSNIYKPNYTCCLIYGPNDNDIVVTRLLRKQDWNYVGKAKLEAKQFVCPNVFKHGRNTKAVAVSLGVDRQCPKNHSKYIIIDYPQKQPGGQLAVCAKLVYGNVSSAAIVEWFEYHRLMGVSKVMVYTYRLNPAAMSVLQYYKSVGMCDYLPFTLPPIGDKDRSVGVKNFQGWNDEQVPVYDCQGRLSGYTYMGLFDVDEYISPSEDRNLLRMLNNLREFHPRAAGFTFKTEIYATTWGPDNETGTLSDLIIGKYTMRTEAYRDRVKSIVLTDRLVPGRMSTHGYWAENKYSKPVADEEVVTLKHYRTCRKEWLKKDGQMCYKTIEKVRDTSMLPYAQMIKHKVLEVKNILGIT